ncbi:MAG: hypothetical protein E7163_01895 [Firmicutes bacterium]|nr:hypothetical protein [Bacillota bacterium]
MKFNPETLREVYDLEKMNFIKSYVSLNLKGAVKYGMEKGLDNAGNWLKIINFEFLNKPIYVDCLASSIARMIYNELQPGIDICNNEMLQERLQQRISERDLAERVLKYHTIAYRDYLDACAENENKLSR